MYIVQIYLKSFKFSEFSPRPPQDCFFEFGLDRALCSQTCIRAYQNSGAPSNTSHHIDSHSLEINKNVCFR
jgi:hypothetical protein